MNKPYQMATEVIDFQKDGFAQKLVAHIGDVRAQIRQKGGRIDSQMAANSIAKMLTDRFGINLRAEVVDEPYYLAIQPPVLDKNHVFFTDKSQRQFIDFALDDQVRQNLALVMSEKNNTVNLAKATISGGFSKIVCPFYISHQELNERLMLDEEVAAGLLHEVGHAFTFFEFMGKMTALNQVMAIVYNEAFSRSSVGERKYLVQTVTGNTDTELIKQLGSSNPAERVTVLLRATVAQPSSVSLTAHYDATSAEALADNFVARFGLGRQLVTCLDKTLGYSPEYTRNRTDAFHMVIVGNIWLGVMSAAFVASSPILGTVLVAIWMASVFLISGESANDYTYDRLRVRYLRLREQMVRSLKASKFKDTEKTLGDIAEIDRIVDGMKQYHGFMDVIFNAVFSKDRKALKSVEVQRMLEELGSNDLYIKAAQLRNLAKA